MKLAHLLLFAAGAGGAWWYLKKNRRPRAMAKAAAASSRGIPAIRTVDGYRCPSGDYMQVGFGTDDPRCAILPK